MKNIIQKKWLAACVATILFLGLQGSMALAMEFINNEQQETENVQSKEEKSDNPGRTIHQEIQKKNMDELSFNSEEKDLLARLVEAEAKGESYEGKVAIAKVVLNRVDSPEFPNSIKDVIYEVVGEAYAFSPVQNGEIQKPASEESIKAVEEAIGSTDRLENAIYFYNPEIATEDWIRTRKIVKTIGNHVFAS